MPEVLQPFSWRMSCFITGGRPARITCHRIKQTQVMALYLAPKTPRWMQPSWKKVGGEKQRMNNLIHEEVRTSPLITVNILPKRENVHSMMIRTTERAALAPRLQLEMTVNESSSRTLAKPDAAEDAEDFDSEDWGQKKITGIPDDLGYNAISQLPQFTSCTICARYLSIEVAYLPDNSQPKV
ncbi:hypothetical protein FIBSPDRAFT_994999 [Athelia psychrophila]|uniref:Uncharacterized protein n=1 Tax=Athelia psychrophila TaxID=1759441 RepID=A0A165XKH5_9AGAM|nr:hypothetical protein FIBSPDRAFT_994999 [Fibularhizoctonia sp. CBS 109695]